MSWNCADKQDGSNRYYKALPEGWFKPYYIGAGLLAVRRSVFETVKAPWFESAYEDFAFCEFARTAGFQVWANSSFVCGHLKSHDLADLMK